MKSPFPSPQPLKWEHFARRELHMAWQLREFCEEGAERRVRATPQSSGSSSRAPAEAGAGGGDSGIGGGADGPVVAVVGRQHAAALRKLWDDPSSLLWRDELPREFSPSVIDGLNERAAAAAEVRGTAAGGGAGGGGTRSSIPGTG
jgi:hypothetical protein